MRYVMLYHVMRHVPCDQMQVMIDEADALAEMHEKDALAGGTCLSYHADLPSATCTLAAALTRMWSL